MKKFLLALFLMSLVVVYAGPGADLFSKLLHLDSPKVHEIKTGDWLSKLAEQYYGDSSYWEELALVNRAPNGNRIFPGEEIVVPSFEAIQAIRESRSISAVNKVLNEQQNILAGKMTSPVADPVPASAPGKPAVVKSQSRRISAEEQVEENLEPTSQDDEVDEFDGEVQTSLSSEDDGSLLSSTPFVTAVAILGVIIAIAVFFFSRRKKDEDLEVHNAEPNGEAYKGGPLFTFDDFNKDDETEEDDDKTEKREKNEKKSVELA